MIMLILIVWFWKVTKEPELCMQRIDSIGSWQQLYLPVFSSCLTLFCSKGNEESETGDVYSTYIYAVIVEEAMDRKIKGEEDK